ncbi:hypothetical protein EAG_11957, partial [Camponotus floridanus]
KEKFDSNIEIIDKTNAYFEGLKKSYYRDDIKKLEYHWNKYTELKGNY